MKSFILIGVLIGVAAALFWLIYALTKRNDSLPKLENPRLVVKKSERQLQVFDGEKLIKTYKIGLGFMPQGDKHIEGDGKTPEGDFYVFTKNDKSSFYLSLGLSYPNIEDATRGLNKKIISTAEFDEINNALNYKEMPPQQTKLGGEIYIHGGGNLWDWTAGCIALENEDMKEVFNTIPTGTAITIQP